MARRVHRALRGLLENRLGAQLTARLDLPRSLQTSLPAPSASAPKSFQSQVCVASLPASPRGVPALVAAPTSHRHVMQRSVARRRVAQLLPGRLGVSPQLDERLHRQALTTITCVALSTFARACRSLASHLRGLPIHVGRDDVVSRILRQQCLAVGLGALDRKPGDTTVWRHRGCRLSESFSGSVEGMLKGRGRAHARGSRRTHQVRRAGRAGGRP